MSVKDIKDTTPNKDLIGILESCLEEAKRGEIRSAVVVASYDDDSVARWWALDARTGLYRVLGKFGVTYAELQAHVASADYQSPFAELRSHD